MVATVNGQGAAFEIGGVRRLFAVRAGGVRSTFQVSPDGKRFLFNLAPATAATPAPINVEVNWLAGRNK